MIAFSRAIVRVPSRNFADGLTTSGMPAPDYGLVLKQHGAYVAVLRELGLIVLELPADEEYPDSTFVEDTAVLTKRGVVLTNPGAPSRTGEVKAIANVLLQFYSNLQSIVSPGTLDGGDVCQADDHFYIGLSARTNEEGARQLSEILRDFGYTSTVIDIRERTESPPMLHLKSGLAYLGNLRLAAIGVLADREEFMEYQIIRVQHAENYAANCIAIKENVLIASGYPGFESQLQQLGYRTVALDMSEFQKMDGGLSCLSLRF